MERSGYHGPGNHGAGPSGHQLRLPAAPRFKGLTVRNLLTIASGNEKLSKDQCCQYLTKVGLCANDYLDREVDASLSGGEVKRIEIATILARSSQLMIFDEPEAGIDLWSFARLTETFEQIHASGTRP